jgi:hypothetical protein
VIAQRARAVCTNPPAPPPLTAPDFEPTRQASLRLPRLLQTLAQLAASIRQHLRV